MTIARPSPAGLSARARLLLAAGLVVGAVGIGTVVAMGAGVVAAAPFILIAAAWGWWRFPGATLAAYLFLPFYKASLGPLSPVDLTPLLALAAAAQAIPVAIKRRPYQGSKVGLALWLGLSITILAGVLWAGQQAIAIDRAAFWWLLILFPSLAALRIASEPDLIDQFIGTAFVVGCVLTVLGIPGIFGLSRLSVAGENTLQTGAITLILALVSIFWVLRVAPMWIRVLASMLIVVGVIESLASGSRGPLLAFLVALLVGVIGRVRSGRALSRRDAGLAALAVAGVAGLVIAVTRLPGQSISRLLLLGGVAGGGAGSSIDTRVDLYSLALRMFTESPLLGHGTGSFAAYTTTHAGLEIYTYPHNDLLQLAAELGIVGAATFAVLVGIALVRPIASTPAWATTRILLAFMLVLAMTSGDIYGDRLMWGLMLLVICAPAALATAARTPPSAVATAQPAYPPTDTPARSLRRGSPS